MKYNTLMRASAIGNLKLVEHLINKGIPVNKKGPRGSTALMFAAGAGHLDVVKFLISKGADPCAIEQGGWNAKMHVVENEDTEMLDYFRSF